MLHVNLTHCTFILAGAVVAIALHGFERGRDPYDIGWNEPWNDGDYPYLPALETVREGWLDGKICLASAKALGNPDIILYVDPESDPAAPRFMPYGWEPTFTPAGPTFRL